MSSHRIITHSKNKRVKTTKDMPRGVGAHGCTTSTQSIHTKKSRRLKFGKATMLKKYMKKTATKMETGNWDNEEDQLPEEVTRMFRELRFQIQALMLRCSVWKERRTSEQECRMVTIITSMRK